MVTLRVARYITTHPSESCTPCSKNNSGQPEDAPRNPKESCNGLRLNGVSSHWAVRRIMLTSHPVLCYAPLCCTVFFSITPHPANRLICDLGVLFSLYSRSSSHSDYVVVSSLYYARKAVEKLRVIYQTATIFEIIYPGTTSTFYRNTIYPRINSSP